MEIGSKSKIGRNVKIPNMLSVPRLIARCKSSRISKIFPIAIDPNTNSQILTELKDDSGDQEEIDLTQDYKRCVGVTKPEVNKANYSTLKEILGQIAE